MSCDTALVAPGEQVRRRQQILDGFQPRIDAGERVEQPEDLRDRVRVREERAARPGARDHEGETVERGRRFVRREVQRQFVRAGDGRVEAVEHFPADLFSRTVRWNASVPRLCGNENERASPSPNTAT